MTAVAPVTREERINLLRGGGMLGGVAGGQPHLVATLLVWAARMVLALADILEDPADADTRAGCPDRRGSARLNLRFRQSLAGMMT